VLLFGTVIDVQKKGPEVQSVGSPNKVVYILLAGCVAKRSQDVVTGGYNVRTWSATKSTAAAADVRHTSCAADVRRATGNSITYMPLAFWGYS